MKSIIKKIFITYLVIICCIYTPTAQAASWSFGGFNFGNGSLNITKNGVKITTAAVDTAPITSSLAKRIASGALRGASFLGALSMATGLALDAIDWVMSDDNTSVKWRKKDYQAKQVWYSNATGKNVYYNSIDDACKSYGAVLYGAAYSGYAKTESGWECKWGGIAYNMVYDTYDTSGYQYKTIPNTTIAQKIVDMAKTGNTAAQADVTSAVTELVNAGTYDTPISQAIQDAIDNGTLPKDTPTDPTTPTTPTNPEIDTSSITAAIQSLASAFASAISNAFNGITSVINTSIDKILNKQDQIQGELVNTGSKIDAVGGQVVGVGDKVDSVGGKVVGVQDAVKDVGGKVVGLSDEVKTVGDKVVGVGDKVDAAGEKVGTRVDAVGDKVTGVGDKVDAAGEKVGTRVDAVGDKVTGVGDKVVGVGDKVDAAGEKTAEAIKESTKEITDKMEQTKPKDFELPAFCSWASKVCDFIDWVKFEPDVQDTPVPTDNTPLKNPADFDKDYINVIAQCPPDVVREIPLPDQSFNLVFGMSPVCDFASTYLRPVIIFLAYIYGALSIGNAFRVGG